MSTHVRILVCRSLLAGLLLIGLAAPVAAQATAPVASVPCKCEPPPPPPPPVWTGSVGAGLAFTQGNKDTSNINLSFDLKRDPKTRTTFKAEGLYILATENGSENVDRGLFNARLEYALGERAYTFGQVGYLRDRFKEIDYLVAPTAGVGYKLLASDRTTLDVDGSVGLVFEKNTGLDVETDGAVSASEKFEHKLSSSASLTQGFGTLWKMNDLADALYTFRAGVAASISTRFQLKVEFQDIYRTRPTGVLVDKNDIAFLSAIVYKF